jgi:hypothetical protein
MRREAGGREGLCCIVAATEDPEYMFVYAVCLATSMLLADLGCAALSLPPGRVLSPLSMAHPLTTDLTRSLLTSPAHY